MKNQKRYFILGLIVSLLMIVLVAGCGSSKKETTTSTTNIYNKYSISLTFPNEGFVYSEDKADLDYTGDNTRAKGIIKGPKYSILVDARSSSWEDYKKNVTSAFKATEFAVGEIKGLKYNYNGRALVALPPVADKGAFAILSVVSNDNLKFWADKRAAKIYGMSPEDPEYKKVTQESLKMFDLPEVQEIIKSIKFVEIKK